MISKVRIDEKVAIMTHHGANYAKTILHPGDPVCGVASLLRMVRVRFSGIGTATR